MYNLTGIYAGNNLIEITRAVNDLTNGILFNVIMMVLFIVILLVFAHRGFREVLIFDSFAMVVISILVFALELASIQVIIFPFVLLATSLLIFFMTR